MDLVGTIEQMDAEVTTPVGAGAPEALTSISLPVGGMTCAACARVIERTLTRLPGVDAAAVNYATGRASVRFDPSLVQLPGIADAVRDVGYEVIEASGG
jgi:Cu+-exporting ATPase